MKTYLIFFTTLVTTATMQANFLRYLPKNGPSFSYSFRVNVSEEHSMSPTQHVDPPVIEQFNDTIHTVATKMGNPLSLLFAHHAHIVLAFPSNKPALRLLINISSTGAPNHLKCASTIEYDKREEILSFGEANDLAQFCHALWDIADTAMDGIVSLMEDMNLVLEESSTLSFCFDLFMNFEEFVNEG